MFQNHGRFAAACYLLVIGSLLHQQNAANAQVEGQLPEKLIAIFYGRNISQKRVFEYAIRLTEKMELAESIRRDLADSLEDETETEPGVQEPVVGYAAYLVSGLIPSVEFVSFYIHNSSH